MNLFVERQIFTPKSTIGQLFIDGVFQCWTLEDVVRPAGVKVPGETAIPAGNYSVTIDESARFGKLMPHVLDVPGFEGIRIHSGNTAADTEGCILLGMAKCPDMVLNSRDAFAAFFPKLQRAVEEGEVVRLSIENKCADPQGTLFGVGAAA